MDVDVGRLLERQLPEAVAIVDLEGIMLWASPRWQDLFGIAPEELVGGNSYDLVHPMDVAFVREAHAALSSQRSVSVRFRLLRGDGSHQWVEIIGRLDPDASVIVTSTRPVEPGDTTAGVLEAERLIASRLQDFDRERQAFFTAVAHRARHPITVVTGVAELLREQWQRMDPTTIDELVARLSSNASRLGQLVEEVTEAEALSRQARGVIRRPVDLRRVVEEQLRAVLPPVRQVHVHVPTGCMVVADRRLLEIALRALLDNAVRHTPDDVSVWVRCEEGADGSLITVDDNGPGIAPADRERIFSPFTSMDSDEHDPSIGLGLYILSEIAAVHGGRAWVQERPGGGASFRLLLPRAAPSIRSHGPIDVDISELEDVDVSQLEASREFHSRYC